MDKTKQTLVIALVAVLVVVAGGWFLLISPQRSKVASLNAETASVDTSNRTLQGELDQLKSEASDKTQEQATLAAIAKRLPADPQFANLLDDLSHAADSANVDLSAITPSAPVAVAPAVAAAAVVTTAPGTSAAPGVVPPKPAAANQLYQIPLALTVTGNYFDLEMFIHSLEGMQRAMLINQLSFAKPSSGTAVTPGGATASDGATLSPQTTVTAGAAATTTTTKASTSKSTKSGKSSTKVSKATAKPVPGSPEAAQAELDRLNLVVPDSNSLTLQITGNIFTMYSPEAAALAATAAASSPTPAATPASTK